MIQLFNLFPEKTVQRIDFQSYGNFNLYFLYLWPMNNLQLWPSILLFIVCQDFHICSMLLRTDSNIIVWGKYVCFFFKILLNLCLIACWLLWFLIIFALSQSWIKLGLVLVYEILYLCSITSINWNTFM